MGLRFAAIGTLVLAGSIWTVWPSGEPTDAPAVVASLRDGRVPAIQQVRAATIEVAVDLDLEVDDDSEASEPEQPALDVDGLTDDERWESQLAEIEDGARASRQGAIHGLVKDARNGEWLAGVTVIAEIAKNPVTERVQVAITDERGYYSFTGLADGDYVVTFYYAGITVERSNVAVVSGTLTPLMQKLQQDVQRELVVVTLDESENPIDVDDIPTFTGIESMENHYVVDSVDVTGLTFGDNE